MADTGKSKFALATEFSIFGEMQGKKAPKWLFFAPSDAAKIKPIKFKKDLLLDPRKWKMKDLVHSCYAVARYDLAIFATHMKTLEKELIKNCNDLLNAKYKKLDDVTGIKDAKKNKDLQKLFRETGGKVFNTYQKCLKNIEDKVSLALDDIEADKGDNKKGLKDGKGALRKFFGTNFKALYSVPMVEAGNALVNLGRDLKSKKEAADALEAALTKLKQAETDFEKSSGKAQDAVNAVIDLGEGLAGNKNSDPALRQLGQTIGSGTEVAKAMEKTHDNIDDVSRDLDKYRNYVAKALKNDHDEKAMATLAINVTKMGADIKGRIPAYIKIVGNAAKKLKKFEAEFKKLEKDLK